MSNIVPDPNGDRNCYRRWDHRELKSVEVEGVLVCPECYVPMNESNPPK